MIPLENWKERLKYCLFTPVCMQIRNICQKCAAHLHRKSAFLSWLEFSNFWQSVTPSCIHVVSKTANMVLKMYLFSRLFSLLEGLFYGTLENLSFVRHWTYNPLVFHVSYSRYFSKKTYYCMKLLNICVELKIKDISSRPSLYRHQLMCTNL